MQDFYPTPGTLSTCMYYTGIDPRDMSEVYVARDPKEKAMQRALLQWSRPEKRALVVEALEETGRTDLIGYEKKCLIRPRKGGKGNPTVSRRSSRRSRRGRRDSRGGKRRPPATGGGGGRPRRSRWRRRGRCRHGRRRPSPRNETGNNDDRAPRCCGALCFLRGGRGGRAGEKTVGLSDKGG